MNKEWLRRIGPFAAAFLLALVVSSLQVSPSQANLANGPDGEVSLDFQDPASPGRTPELPDGGSGGGSSGGGSRGAADPDEFSVNSPHMHGPDVVTQRVPVRLDWTQVLRLWLMNLAIYFLIRRV